MTVTRTGAAFPRSRRSPGARASVTAREAAAITVIAVAGEDRSVLYFRTEAGEVLLRAQAG